jgi:hypothetical protein
MQQLAIWLLVGPADHFEDRELDPASGRVARLVRAEGEFHDRNVIGPLPEHGAVGLPELAYGPEPASLATYCACTTCVLASSPHLFRIFAR